MVDVFRVACNQCGAPLEVASGTRFVTCNYCSSRLEVHRSDSASYTSVLEAIQDKTAQMAEDLSIIRLQNELEQLDRQWEIEREQYKSRNKDGTTRLPETTPGGVVAQWVGGGFFILFTIGMGIAILSSPAPGFFALFPFGMAFMVFILLIVGQQHAGQYAERLQQYERQREEILDQIRRQTRLPRDIES